jgi:hypothetical protein
MNVTICTIGELLVEFLAKEEKSLPTQLNSTEPKPSLAT